MFIRPSFAILFFAVATFARPVRRDFTDALSEIIIIRQNVQALDAAIQAFQDSGATLSSFEHIQEYAVILASKLRTAASNLANGGAFTDAQADEVIGAVISSEGDIDTAIGDLVAKKPVILTFSGLVPFIVNDLDAIDSGVEAFAAALEAVSPADKKDVIKEVKDDIISCITAAVSAFTS